MLLSRKRFVFNLLAIASLLLIAYLLRFVLHPLTNNSLLAISMMTLRWAIQVTLSVLWVVSIRRRILNTAIRNMILTVGFLLIFWQIVRIIKYDYVIITEPIGRYLWYCFYIPMVLAPLIGVFVVEHIGKPEGWRSQRWMKWMFVPAAFLILAVFTNDLHQKVFTFHNGFALYNSDYGYGPVYFLEMAWFVVLSLRFAVMLLLKSRVPGSRKFQMLPLIVTVFAVLFWTGYSLKLYTGDLTAVDCLFIILLLEGAIQSGLIPSNMNYRELFERSTIAAQIADSGEEIRYVSANAVPMKKEEIKRAMEGPVDLGETIVHAQAIRGGHVFWQDDVRDINELAMHLRDANETLSERYDLMKAELALKERRLQAEEKSRLYDRIAQEMSARLTTAGELLKKSRENPENANALLSEICVISAYIKRRANLILLGEEKAEVSVQELESCLRESMDNLRLCGVITYLDSRLEGTAEIDRIIAVYDLFEDVTENLIGQMNAMMVTAEYASGVIRLRIQAGCTKEGIALTELSLPGGTVVCEKLEEDLVITASCGEGGTEE